ncbi:MAG: thioredoxin domain-containing protein [Thermomicrobiales bacterium]
MTREQPTGGVAWQEWGTEAFERAQAEEKPILLSISAVWCHWCHVMDRTTYSDPAVAALIHERYIPIRVDNDLRPDVNERYNQGGWPTTAFLTPDGYIIYGGTYLPPEQMRALLPELSDYYAANREEIDGKTAAALAQEQTKRDGPGGTTLPENAANIVLEQMERQYDSRFGGFGFGTKFPHPEALDLVIASFWQTRDPFWQEMATRTLDGMAERGMHDHVAGGFFRYSTDRAWQTPHYEKMSEVNGALIRTSIHAAMVFGIPKYAVVAHRTLGYVMDTLVDPDGGIRGSQDADEEYYRRDAAGRAALTPPAVDPRIYTNWSARVASSLLLAHVALVDDPRREEYRAVALRTVDRLLAVVQDEDGGMFHLLAPDGTRGEKGLLADQVWMAHAALDAYAQTGDADYRVQAQRIAAFMLRALLAPTGLRDRPLDELDRGLLGEPVYNLPDNAAAADLFLRLAWLTGEETYQQIAERLLAGFTEVYAAQGVFAAGYALAWARAHSEPRHVVIVGPQDDPNVAAMRAVACTVYHPWSVVEPLDPARDAERIAVLGYPVAPPRAYPCIGKVCQLPVSDASALAATLARMRP